MGGVKEQALSGAYPPVSPSVDPMPAPSDLKLDKNFFLTKLVIIQVPKMLVFSQVLKDG